MNIKSAQYMNAINLKDGTTYKDTVKLTIDGMDDTQMFVPLDPANTNYAEIMKQVADGTLTIKDAD